LAGLVRERNKSVFPLQAFFVTNRKGSEDE